MKKTFVFLLYDNRSGSTLLSAILNMHKGVSVSQESSFIHRIIELKKKPEAESIEDILGELSQEVQFREFNFDNKKFIDDIKNEQKGLVGKKKLIELILERYFQKRDPQATVRIIKQGDYLYIKDLIEMFPDSLFIQIIRDGRAVFNSKKQTSSFDGEPQDTNPLHASWNWTQKLKKAEFYKDRFINVRYEDLIEDPEDTLHSVMDQLGLPPDLRKKTKKQADYFQDLGNRQKPLHQNIKDDPKPEFINKWKDQLSKEEIAVFTWWADTYLKKGGYEIQKFPKSFIYYHSFRYFIVYLYRKTINVLKLLKSPGLLKTKLERKLRMIKRN